MVGDTARMLLDVLVQANEKKVKRKLQELAGYNIICDLNEKYHQTYMILTIFKRLCYSLLYNFFSCFNISSKDFAFALAVR